MSHKIDTGRDFIGEAVNGIDDIWCILEGVISALAFSPNGKYIASAEKDGTIRIWSCGPYEKR